MAERKAGGRVDGWVMSKNLWSSYGRLSHKGSSCLSWPLPSVKQSIFTELLSAKGERRTGSELEHCFLLGVLDNRKAHVSQLCDEH